MRNAGLSATVSPRALIIFAPIDGSFAQRGHEAPAHLHQLALAGALSRTIGTGCIGAML